MPKWVAMVERKINRSGVDTRVRIIDAVLETVRNVGLVGTSARVIARTGGFNQALVFYHFGSIDELLLAALERANERRMERFRVRLEAVDDLPGIVSVAMQMHADLTDPDFEALTAIVAGWSTKSDVGSRVLEILKPWDDLVEGALSRSLQATSLGSLVSTTDLAHAMSALFLGLEMMSRLETDSRRTESVYASLAGGASFLTAFLQARPSETSDGPDSPGLRCKP